MKKDPLNEILELDFSKNIRWSDRRKRCGGYYKKIKKIRAIIDLISGNDSLNMLNDIYSEKEKSKFYEKEKNCLKNIKDFYVLSKPSVRRNLIHRIKRAKLTIRKAREYGFKVSSTMWSIPLKKAKLIKNKLSEDLIFDLNTHIDSLSEIASNRTIKIDEEIINVKYMRSSISEAYYRFIFKS